ncbi:MAG: hypothetical protein IPN82_06230 [Chitinophagaceae bacterium]|nr:hypothetical protein [Chitinophagaceae bacterium]MBP6479076.1 hypothetical protein [Chitinophagaceae bacterium]MBP7107745.1 hypothetical protein [Chitinophagaceae bacterium]HRA12093.1 hypothetical protein [Chitinophagaceae bacterium]
MKNLFICIAIIILFHNYLFAQKSDSLNLVYNNQTIYRYGGSFLKGNEKLNFKDLSREFNMSDLGQISYEKAKSYRTKSVIFKVASIACGIASLAIISNNSSNRNTALIFLGGQIVTGYAGGKLSQLSAQNLDRALWQRNKDVLFPGRQ